MIRKLGVILVSGLICLVGVTSVWAAKYNEAPMLKAKVATGELPSVEQRLPEKPQVVEPIEEIGQYGGTAHLYYNVVGNPGQAKTMTAPEPVLSMDWDRANIVPNLAENWEFSEKGKVLTLHLKKGIKWSDGAPFTADDFLFWYEDILLNDELTPAKPKVWCPGDELMKMKKIDDYTIQLSFSVPYPTVTLQLAGPNGYRCYRPKHYAEQFHPRYTSKEKLEKLAKEEGYEHWYELFEVKVVTDWDTWPDEANYPTLLAFVLKEKKGITTRIMERNPYYWKVDTEGNQLPYIDEIECLLIQEKETRTMKTISGELSFNSSTMEDFPFYQENRKKGDYRILTWYTANGRVAFFLNQNHPNPVLRRIIQDRRFRIALSLALNRKEINEVAFFGKVVPSQASVYSGSSFYEEKFEKAYTEHNPIRANELLDEIGLIWDEDHEYRLMPDGKRLSLTIEWWEFPIVFPTSVFELTKEYWEEVGVKIILKPEERSFNYTRMCSGEMDVFPWIIDRATTGTFIADPRWWVPINWPFSYGPAWSLWYTTNGEKGEEPPREIKRLFEAYEKMQTTLDETERIQAGKEILRSQAENLWIIGTVSNTFMPVAVKNNLRNFPDKIMMEFGPGLYMAPYHTEQLFFKQR